MIYHLIPACVICSSTAPVRCFSHNYTVPDRQMLAHVSGGKAKSSSEGDVSRLKEPAERDAGSC